MDSTKIVGQMTDQWVHKMFQFLNTKIQWISGIGPLLAQRLAASGWQTFFDLLATLPTKYTLYESGLLPKNGPVYMEICLGIMQGRNPWKIPCRTSCGQSVTLVFFHRPKPIWRPHTRVWIKGTIMTSSFGVMQIAHPEWVMPWPLQQGEMRIVPEYALPKGISCQRFSKWIRYIVDDWPDPEWSPIPMQFTCVPYGSEQMKNRLSWLTCFQNAHFPTQKNMISDDALWRSTLAHDEWVAQHIASTQWDQNPRSQDSVTVCVPQNRIHEENFLHAFGYALTPSQYNAWTTIAQELRIGIPMMRLLHGDVGSGKTLVAFLALIHTAASGKQACLMAPTETLIRQHFAVLTRYLKDISVQLILGQNQRIGPADAPIVLGTHALLYDNVSFENLACIVIDEQQRFGVQQRLTLMEKGNNPHILFLSATPIPRTLQRVMCGKMDLSCIEKRPSSMGIQSYVVSIYKIQNFYSWIQRVLAQKECIYWVCPAIEDENCGVLQRWAYWNEYFPGRVGFLHGDLSIQEKERVMVQFRSGEKPILVTTTVIEVGIDVPQASTIFIEESPRFGLSQLHQLRGRVGRGNVAGHCFFLYTPELNISARKRLHFMRTCEDGFKIAEQDLMWRGSGTLWGMQQSGQNSMRFIKEGHEQEVLSSAQNAAFILDHHPTLCASLLSLFRYKGLEISAAG